MLILCRLNLGAGIHNKMKAEQLILPVTLKEGLSFDNFLEPSGGQIVETLKNQWNTNGQRFIYLCGGIGSGCSHLLQSACDYAFKRGHQSLYLPLADLIDKPTSMLNELENYPLIAIDNVECLIDQPQWQKALFDLYHRIQVREGHLLMASSFSPVDLNLELKDLDSRIRSALCLRVNKLDDQDKQAAFILHAKGRGLVIEPKVASYILNHALRDMHKLQTLMDELSLASLAQKRRITIPFVKQILNNRKN